MSRMSENVGASTSRNPKGLHGLYVDNFTFTLLKPLQPGNMDSEERETVKKRSWRCCWHMLWTWHALINQIKPEFYKVKVKLSLWLINSALCHEDVWGSGCIAPPFLTLALDGGEWSTLHPSRFTPGEIASSAYWKKGRMDPRASLNTVQMRKILPCWESNPAVQPIARHYTSELSRILCLNYI
jgi:hypothetical protein